MNRTSWLARSNRVLLTATGKLANPTFSPDLREFYSAGRNEAEAATPGPGTARRKGWRELSGTCRLAPRRYPGHAGPAFAADGRLPPCSLSTGAGHPLALPADGAEPLARWFRGPGPHLLSLRLQPAPQPPAQDGPPAAETPAHATGVAGAASPASPLQPWGPDGGYWLASTAGPPVSLFATSSQACEGWFS